MHARVRWNPFLLPTIRSHKNNLNFITVNMLSYLLVSIIGALILQTNVFIFIPYRPNRNILEGSLMSTWMF